MHCVRAAGWGRFDACVAVECGSGVLRCVVCRVFIWNHDLQKVLACARAGLVPSLLRTAVDPCDDELNPKVFTRHCVGVKGLYNLGNTCFMNSVLQALLHIPDLARFFLPYGAAGHRRAACAVAPCVACEMDALLVRVYNGNRKPVCPSGLLHAVWREASEMAGYEQQDAHEFFLCLRAGLHRALDGQQFNCECIVHRLFSGVLQSDVTCPECRSKNETYDPFLDISLDLVHQGGQLGSVEECLRVFTKTESISTDTYQCANCSLSLNDVNKRMAIRSAPKVLVVHLKRFEHGSTRTKIDRHVGFPLLLDLGAYSAETLVVGDEQMLGMAAGHPPYKLLAVVAHVGTLDSGHYTSYVRYRDEWFFVDDALVTLTTEAAVLAAPAYMLFYAALSTYA